MERTKDRVAELSRRGCDLVTWREFPQHSRAPGRLLSAAVPALAALGASSGFGRSDALDHSLRNGFSSERKMFTVETKIPVARTTT